MIDELLQSPLATTIEYYRRCVDEKTKAFLSKNALGSEAVLRVGFADRSFGKQFPVSRCEPGRRVRERLKEAGILKPNGREVFRGHVTVPLTSGQGETTGIYALRLDRLAGQERIIHTGNGLFNAAALDSFEEVILCDTPLDAWTFFAAGHANDFQPAKRGVAIHAANPPAT